jgi:hypothetical protein
MATTANENAMVAMMHIVASHTQAQARVVAAEAKVVEQSEAEKEARVAAAEAKVMIHRLRDVVAAREKTIAAHEAAVTTTLHNMDELVPTLSATPCRINLCCATVVPCTGTYSELVQPVNGHPAYVHTEGETALFCLGQWDMAAALTDDEPATGVRGSLVTCTSRLWVVGTTVQLAQAMCNVPMRPNDHMFMGFAECLVTDTNTAPAMADSVLKLGHWVACGNGGAAEIAPHDLKIVDQQFMPPLQLLGAAAFQSRFSPTYKMAFGWPVWSHSTSTYSLARTNKGRWMVMNDLCVGRDKSTGRILSTCSGGHHIWEHRGGFDNHASDAWKHSKQLDWIPLVDVCFDFPADGSKTWPEHALALATTLEGLRFAPQDTKLAGDRWFKASNGFYVVWHEAATTMYDAGGIAVATGKNLNVTVDWDLTILGAKDADDKACILRSRRSIEGACLY